MMKRAFIFLALLFVIRTAQAQQVTYTLPTPKGWTVEKLILPIAFAPNIPVKGMEELRFMPGWNDSKSNEYWSYSFLWFLDGQQSYKKDTLESYLTQYFTGLYLSNLKDKTNVPAPTFTSVKVKKGRTDITDQQTFEAKITTLNMLNGQALTLHARIHVRTYLKEGHTAVLFELSPQDFDNVVWDRLDGVANGFKLN